MSSGGVSQLVASSEDLEEFSRLPEATRHLNPSLRGVLAEIAAMGVIRYSWPLVRPVLEVLLDNDIAEFEAFSRVEVGPPQPTANGETPAQLRKRLRGMLHEFETEAPFTLQRLCEVLLEPSKQYTRLDKLGLALEKLLMVTSTVQPSRSPPERPTLASLPPVNENPPTPVLPTANGPIRHEGAMANGAASRAFGDTFSTVAEAAFMNSGHFRSYRAPSTAQPQQLQNGNPTPVTEHSSEEHHTRAAPRVSLPDVSVSAAVSTPGVANGAAAAALPQTEAEPPAAEDRGGGAQQAQGDASAPAPQGTVDASRHMATDTPDNADHGATASIEEATAHDTAAKLGNGGDAFGSEQTNPVVVSGVTAASAHPDAADEQSAVSGVMDMAVDGIASEQPPAKRAASQTDDPMVAENNQSDAPAEPMSDS